MQFKSISLHNMPHHLPAVCSAIIKPLLIERKAISPLGIPWKGIIIDIDMVSNNGQFSVDITGTTEPAGCRPI
jgi:hypothetical protein